MSKTRTVLAAASIALASFASAAPADNLATVKTFYDLIDNPTSDATVSAFKDATSEDWISQGDYSGKNKTRDAFLGQMGGFGKVMPDLNCDVPAMYDAGDFVTVRSRATATPVAPFFGVDGQGRGFDIMAIDIHQIEDGKIVHTYHVEDWSTALRQLSGK